MKYERLKELIDELAKDIMKGTEQPFHYELCPKFDNCSMKVQKKCIFDYENCPTYIKQKRGAYKK